MERYVVPILAAPWDPTAPRRSYGTEGAPLWIDGNNLRPHDGKLMRRPAAIKLASQPTPLLRTYGSGSRFGEMPVWLYANYAPNEGAVANNISSGSCGNTEVNTYSPNTHIILVTTRCIYIKTVSSGWVNATPTYTAGTITASTGSPNITGSSTYWVDRFIDPFMVLEAQGAYYGICAIGGNTSITLDRNYAGAGGAGLSYKIWRTFGGGAELDERAQAYCHVFNSELYVAGPRIGGDRPAVLKVSSLFDGSPTTTYLTSSDDITGSLDNISALDDIVGMQPMSDGRLVMAVNEGGNDHRIRYSSHLDTSVWTTAPAGASDEVEINGPILALGKIRDIMTLHHAKGIALGYPTGEDGYFYSPLNFQPSLANVGALSPNTVSTYQGVEMYVGVDRQLHLFDLNVNHVIGNTIKGELDISYQKLRYGAHATIDTYRDEYVLFLPNGDSTVAVHMNRQNRQWWKATYAAEIGAASQEYPLSASRGAGHMLVGIASSETGGQTYSMLNLLQEGVGADTMDSYAAGSRGSIYRTTGPLDFGLPGIDKHIDHIVVGYKPNIGTTSENLEVAVSNDGGATWDTDEHALSYSADFEGVQTFFFTHESEENLMIRLKFADDDNTAYGALLWMIVYWEPEGDVEATS